MENGNGFKAEAMVVIQDSEEFMRDLLAALDTKLDKKAKAEPTDEILTAKEAMEILHISSKQFYKLRKEGRIRFSQSGKKIYVRRSEIDRYINSHSTNTL